MKPLGGRALLKEVRRWVRVLKVYSLTPLPVTSLSFLFIVEDVVSQSLLWQSVDSHASLPHHLQALPLEP